MAAATRTPSAAATALQRIGASVGAKLFTLVLTALVSTLALLGWANIRFHRRNLESATQQSAARLSDVIVRSIGYSMLRNDREALRGIIGSVAREPEIVALRIINERGVVAVSTDPKEERTYRGSRVEPGSTLRITRGASSRLISVVTPIPNAPSCASAACHAHAPSQKLLGMLDADLSLASTDRSLSRSTWQFLIYSAAAVALILLSTALFVWRFVHQPVTTLRFGTDAIARGALGVQIPIATRDELGDLARSFNDMSRQLLDARNESNTWAHTLEERVAEKTSELERVHRQMLQAEKLTSLGKLAAVVAHEINNPLSGILTYARLLRKWIERKDSLEEHAKEMSEALELIATESRRCGDIVQNLLAFARVTPMNIEDVDLGEIARRCIKLVEHKLYLGNIAEELDLDPNLPRVRGDASQLEQLLLALVMNAIEAMPHDGNLRVTTRAAAGGDRVIVTVEDDGIGIPTAILPQLFEPFVTTKEAKGVGLGLAVSKSVVERHHGQISVRSTPGQGTTFTIELPVEAMAADLGESKPATTMEGVA
jgi:two-component system NtrC family sensor kinase